MNGPDTWDNLQITHWKTNEEKSDKNTFEANGKLFQVKRLENLFDEDKMANYPYKRCHKQYCVIIVLIYLFLSVITLFSCQSFPEQNVFTLNGAWQLTNGSIMIIQGKAFVILNSKRQIADRGVFIGNNNAFIVNSVKFGISNYQYIINTNKEMNVISLDITDTNRTPITWKKNISMSKQILNSKFPAGCWERKDDEGVTEILCITPWGWGFNYYYK